MKRDAVAVQENIAHGLASSDHRPGGGHRWRPSDVGRDYFFVRLNGW
ncbi:MAG: hypothetical protein ACRDRJ_34050 [Streptosporangiaceae bacterium]|jgi:hypothetical protein